MFVLVRRSSRKGWPFFLCKNFGGVKIISILHHETNKPNHEINEGTMPPFAFRRDSKTRLSQRERFTFALGTNQNRCNRSKSHANRHKHSQNSPNVAGGLVGANLANGRANLRGAVVF